MATKKRGNNGGGGRRKQRATPEEIAKAEAVEVKVTMPQGEGSEGSAMGDASFELQRLREQEEDRKRREHAERVEFYRRQRKQKAHVPFDEARQDEYLAALEATGLYVAAADAAGIHRDTAHQLRDKDKTFAIKCEVALERYRKKLIAEAERRAVVGFDEPVYQQGSFVGVKRVYSDRMLEILLKAKGGGEFKDKVAVEQSGHVSTSNTNVNLNASTSVAKLEKMTPEQRQALRLVLGVPIGASARPSDERRPGEAPDDLATLGLERHTVDGGDDGEGN